MTSSSDNSFRPVVLAPTYNNAGTLPDILRRIDLLHLAAIIVNDGSTDGTGDCLERWRRGAQSTPRFVVTHPDNQGKAAALHTGFAAAQQGDFTHAITIDTDGQLDPEQIPDLVALTSKHADALILGVRDDTKADYPFRSRLGRRISNLAIRAESGLHISDSQCGLRVYPLALLSVIHCTAPFFAFEAEVITRAAWAGCRVIEFPANCRYFTPPARVSHFRPVIDTLRGLRLHARLLAQATIPFARPRRRHALGAAPHDATGFPNPATD